MSPFVTNRLILASYLIMALNSDQSFIEKAIHGDTRAYGFLVEKYQDYIFTIVLRILKVREEAEEVAQDTFLKAYEALPGFRGESRFSTWLYQIAYRKALDRLKQISRLTTIQIKEEVTGEALENLDNGLNFMLREERSELIRRSILKLPEQEAVIIGLYYFEEQSVKEIAQITSLSEENIKVKLYRSRKLLFSLLEKYMASEIPWSNGKAL